MPIYYIFKGIFSDMVFDGRIQHHIFEWLFCEKKIRGWFFMMANLVILI
jgi:hypothetical protein